MRSRKPREGSRFLQFGNACVRELRPTRPRSGRSGAARSSGGFQGPRRAFPERGAASSGSSKNSAPRPVFWKALLGTLRRRARQERGSKGGNGTPKQAPKSRSQALGAAVPDEFRRPPGQGAFAEIGLRRERKPPPAGQPGNAMEEPLIWPFKLPFRSPRSALGPAAARGPDFCAEAFAIKSRKKLNGRTLLRDQSSIPASKRSKVR